VIADIAILLILLIYLNDEISIDLGTIGIQLFCGTIRWISGDPGSPRGSGAQTRDLIVFRERRVIRGVGELMLPETPVSEYKSMQRHYVLMYL